MHEETHNDNIEIYQKAHRFQCTQTEQNIAQVGFQKKFGNCVKNILIINLENFRILF